jgi:hypothetical protein
MKRVYFERMSSYDKKGYAVGIAYHPRVKTLWLMFGFFMIEIHLGW